MEKKPESIFINRELSWLDFDSRVLALAKEKTVPLGERIKFAAIFGSNMDEFFMVRVGSLYDQTLLKTNKTDNVTHMTAANTSSILCRRLRSRATTRWTLPSSASSRSISGKPTSSVSCCPCSARRSWTPAIRSPS